MYLNGTDILGAIIALSVAIFALILTFYANYKLLEENRNIQATARARRKHCMANHTEVPF